MVMFKWIAKLLFSLGLMAVLFWKADTAMLARHIFNMSPLMLVLSALLILVAVAIRAYRWSAMMSAYKVKLSFRKSFELIQIGNFYGQFLPMTVGGDVVRTWQAHRDGLPIRASIHTVLLDRWFGFVSLLVIILGSIPALPQTFLKSGAGWLLAMLAFLALVGLGSVLVLDQVVGRWHHIKILAEASTFSKSARQFSANISLSIPIFIASIATHLLSIVAIKVLADGMGAHVSFYQMLILMPPVMLLTMLPISLAGWGVREGAMIFALAYVGVPHEQALAVSILLGIVSLVISLPGGLVMLYSPASLVQETPQ